MKLRTKIILMIGLIVAIATSLFEFVAYTSQHEALLNGIDSKLLATAHMARSVLSEDYHNNIQDIDH